jgi:hypothetical protein
MAKRTPRVIRLRDGLIEFDSDHSNPARSGKLVQPAEKA